MLNQKLTSASFQGFLSTDNKTQLDIYFAFKF